MQNSTWAVDLTTIQETPPKGIHSTGYILSPQHLLVSISYPFRYAFIKNLKSTSLRKRRRGRCKQTAILIISLPFVLSMNPFVVPVLVVVAISLILPFVRPIAYVMYLAIVNFAIFIYLLAINSLSPDLLKGIITDLAFTPEFMASRPHTVITSFFLHLSPLHILGNIIFLVLFGMPLEHRIGYRRIAIIYTFSGVMASLIDGVASFTFYGDPGVPRLGASGAIFGIMGTYLVLFPKDEILMPLMFIITRAPVWMGVLLYGGFETFLATQRLSDGIGHMAHAAGLMSGLLMGPLIFRRRSKTVRIADLRVLARDDESKELLGLIEKEDIPDVREVWIEQLVDRSKCPRCGMHLRLRGDTIECDCGFSLRFR